MCIVNTDDGMKVQVLCRCPGSTDDVLERNPQVYEDAPDLLLELLLCRNTPLALTDRARAKFNLWLRVCHSIATYIRLHTARRKTKRSSTQQGVVVKCRLDLYKQGLLAYPVSLKTALPSSGGQQFCTSQIFLPLMKNKLPFSLIVYKSRCSTL